jgi:Domain of unknown function (DUF1905)
MLPMKAEIREAIGKDTGDTVTVTLEERIGSAKPRQSAALLHRPEKTRTL